jgi:hypothetical protein
MQLPGCFTPRNDHHGPNVKKLFSKNGDLFQKDWKAPSAEGAGSV